VWRRERAGRERERGRRLAFYLLPRVPAARSRVGVSRLLILHHVLAARQFDNECHVQCSVDGTVPFTDPKGGSCEAACLIRTKFEHESEAMQKVHAKLCCDGCKWPARPENEVWPFARPLSVNKSIWVPVSGAGVGLVSWVLAVGSVACPLCAAAVWGGGTAALLTLNWLDSDSNIETFDTMTPEFKDTFKSQINRAYLFWFEFDCASCAL
jgi:hypothetical protein